MTKVTLPQLGEGINKATISFWYKQEGENVSEKEDLVELSTDKAVFNLPAPCSGKLTKILCKEGETVDIGSIVAEME